MKFVCIMTLEAGGDGTLLTDIPLGIGPVLGKFIPFFVYIFEINTYQVLFCKIKLKIFIEGQR